MCNVYAFVYEQLVSADSCLLFKIFQHCNFLLATVMQLTGGSLHGFGGTFKNNDIL